MSFSQLTNHANQNLLAGLTASLVAITFCSACAPQTKPSYRLGLRSREHGYVNKAEDREVAHIFALLQYDPNTANQKIEAHLRSAKSEWTFYALLGDVLLEAKRYDYSEAMLKLAYAKLIKRIPSAEIHDSNGILPIETGMEFQANHDPRRLLAKLYCEKLDAIRGSSLKENATKEQIFKEAIFYNPRNNGIWKRYAIFLQKQNRTDESITALGNMRGTYLSLDRGTTLRITGVKTPWSAADQDNYKVGYQRKG